MEVGEEEVSTKFSRFKDSESESEEESENEKSESESSDEAEDVLALNDDDDDFEALMAQVEHVISQDDVEPSKKDKKKGKGSKSKDKEAKRETDKENKAVKEAKEEKSQADKVKSDIQTVKDDTVEVRIIKFEDKQNTNNLSTPLGKVKTPEKISSQKTNCTVQINRNSPPSSRSSPVRNPNFTNKKSPSPSNQRQSTPPSHSPPRFQPDTVRIVTKTGTPVKQSSISPRRSPIRSKSPGVRPLSPRRISPRKFSPDRRSPLRISPDKYYGGNKSPSSYYKPRDREYFSKNRSRSPITRRRSLSPRRSSREPSPKYYHRRSRSPWSPGYRPAPPRSRSPSPRYRSRSPIHRRSFSPRNKKQVKSTYIHHSPHYYGSPTRRTPTLSPKRPSSPRKKEYSPRRRPISPRRDLNYRRHSVSPKRVPTPPYKTYSPPHSPRYKQRSPSPRSVSPRRRLSPADVKDSRTKVDRRSRTPSLSLSPSPARDTKETTRRYKSPLRPRKESAENVSNRTTRARRGHSPGNKVVVEDLKDRRRTSNKIWDKDRGVRDKDRDVRDRERDVRDKETDVREKERDVRDKEREVRDKDREGRRERKLEDRKRDRTIKGDRESRKDRETSKEEKQNREEPKEELTSLKVTDNPVFEARRKKFESNAVVEPSSKKICLVSNTGRKINPDERKQMIEEKVLEKESVEEKKTDVMDKVQVVEEKVEDDGFSEQEEMIDEIDNFLNEDEDVLNLAAEGWSSDDELFPKSNKKAISLKNKSPVKQTSVKERISVKEKVERSKPKNASPLENKAVRTSPPVSPVKTKAASLERDREDCDLRAELSRRREERLTKAGSLHDKVPTRLLQSAFEGALGKEKTKKDKSQKIKKEEKNKKAASPPTRKERTDGRRVLVLKRPTAVKMQSAHINVTFPKDARSDSSESSYSSSSSEEERLRVKRKLPVYLRLGKLGNTATDRPKRSGGRKVKLRNRRSQV